MRSVLMLAWLAIAACKTAPEPAEDVIEQYTDSLQVEDLKVGTGAVAEPGMHLTVHYTGYFTTGVTFDTSLNKEPLTFELGERRVIKGWDDGLAGMRVGGKRKLIVPPHLGYGKKAVGTIPPNSRLIFEVELLSAKP